MFICPFCGLASGPSTYIVLPMPEPPAAPAEGETADLSPEDALRNIRLRAASGASFGHQATPQTPERMVEEKDEALRDILKYCQRAGVAGSLLRAEGETAEGLSAEPVLNALSVRSDTVSREAVTIIEAQRAALTAAREAQARLTRECEMARAEHRGSAAAAASLRGDLQRYAQALILAWGGVCPADWAMDPTQPMHMAETIRARGEELQADVSTLRAKLAEAERREAPRCSCDPHPTWPHEPECPRATPPDKP